ncbi:response regulator, partial [Thermodesulfobacteriota bacterium]
YYYGGHEGEEAVEKAERAGVALVLLDMALEGEVNGIETALQIRERLSVPVIFLTDGADKALLERARSTRPYGYLAKPICRQLVGSTIQSVLDIQAYEQDLERTAAKFETLADAAPLGISVMTPDRAFECLNPRFTDILGYTIDDLPDKDTWFRIAYPELDSRERVVSAWEKETTGRSNRGNIVPGVFNVRCKDGSDKAILFRIVVLEDGRHITTYQDITERKKTEQSVIQSERLRAVADLASGVAHNFNNLLQIVVGGAHLALMNLELGNFSEIRTTLEEILESSRFGADTVKRLQDFALVGEGDSGEERKALDLSLIVQRAIEMSKPWWKSEPQKRGIEISLLSDLGDGCSVKGRQSELFEMVVNLIKNAAEALPEGCEIAVSTSAVAGDAILRVKDNGVGINPEASSP